MVTRLRMWILKSFFHLMWLYFLTHSEFSCLAKPYPVSGPTYMLPILDRPNCISRCAHEVFIIVYWATLTSVLTLKPFALFIKG